jgi:hypothetical protein
VKAWITAPFDDDGIQEIEIIGEPNDANLLFRRKGCPFGHEQSINWYREGFTWHRSYAAALEMAAEHRKTRIAKAATECARVAALPPLPQ